MRATVFSRANPAASPRDAAVTVTVPGPLRQYCAGASELTVTAPTVRAALEEIEHKFPSLYSGVCDETGAVRAHVNVFVGMDNIRDLQGLDTALAPRDVMTILPSVSGG